MVLALTMVIFIMQFRSQKTAIKEDAYQRALDDYTASITMLVERPELGRILDDMGRATAQESMAKTLTAEDRAIFGYMLLNYSLFERIYALYTRKWIDDDTWSQWHTWMRTMAKHPMFQEVHRRSQGTFDRAFQDLVDKAAASSG